MIGLTAGLAEPPPPFEAATGLLGAAFAATLALPAWVAGVTFCAGAIDGGAFVASGASGFAGPFARIGAGGSDAAATAGTSIFSSWVVAVLNRFRPTTHSATTATIKSSDRPPCARSRIGTFMARQRIT